jgi:hypothetical protein
MEKVKDTITGKLRKLNNYAYFYNLEKASLLLIRMEVVYF